MSEFLQANLASIVGMVIMVIVVILFQFHSAKGNTETLNKKRIERGLTTMNDAEKLLTTKAIRTAGISVAVMMLTAYIVSLLLAYFF